MSSERFKKNTKSLTFVNQILLNLISSQSFKRFFLMVWIFLFFYFIYYIKSSYSPDTMDQDLPPKDQIILSIKQFTMRIEKFMVSLGWLGPLFYIFIFLIRPFVFFPPSLLTAVSGIVYGPILGSIYSIIGENLSANLAFGVSRWQVGEVKDEKYRFISFLNRKVKEDGIYLIFVMRTLYFPFDLLNFGAGLSKIKWKDYCLGTFWGILPGIIAFAILGSSAKQGMDSLIIAGIIFTISIIFGYLIKRSKIAREIEQVEIP